MLRLDNLHVAYGDIQVIWGISLEVRANSIVALLGSNGAGKTTTLKAVVGLLPPKQGTVNFKGNPLNGRATHEIVSAGLYLVPEWRGTFSSLTVLENLELGAFTARARPHAQETLQQVYEIFPWLPERAGQKAGTLSGGERQMLGIGRAIMARPDMLMLDEPSLGLAPIIVEHIFEVIKRISTEGMTVLIVEQNVGMALEIADYSYIIENGRIVGEGSGENLLQDEKIQAAYLGI